MRTTRLALGIAASLAVALPMMSSSALAADTDGRSRTGAQAADTACRRHGGRDER